jgi:LacI family transcriptional regulator
MPNPISISEPYPVQTMKARVTQSDIARVAGVHNTTVSLALRNCPAIPEATRQRIQTIAGEMGYYPDPALRALAAYRQGRRPYVRQQTIAYITNWDTRWGWREVPAQARYYLGAQRKAAQSGYRLEHFWLGESGMTPRRLSDMLFHRGITGVLLASHRSGSSELLEFDWSRLTAVKIGCLPHLPALHRVMDDQTGSVRLAMRKIFAAGYERAGLIVPAWWDDLANQSWSTGFLAEQSRLRGGQRVPILRYNHPRTDAETRGDMSDLSPDLSLLRRWYNQYRPDAILGFSTSIASQLSLLGLPVPGHIGCVNLFLGKDDHHCAGIWPHCERTGEIATEMLVALMQQNICGIPDVPTTTLVEGSWVDGASLPSLLLRTTRLSKNAALDPVGVPNRSTHREAAEELAPLAV